jgi:hypothetical protein
MFFLNYRKKNGFRHFKLLLNSTRISNLLILCCFLGKNTVAMSHEIPGNFKAGNFRKFSGNVHPPFWGFPHEIP